MSELGPKKRGCPKWEGKDVETQRGGGGTQPKEQEKGGREDRGGGQSTSVEKSMGNNPKRVQENYWKQPKQKKKVGGRINVINGSGQGLSRRKHAWKHRECLGSTQAGRPLHPKRR